MRGLVALASRVVEAAAPVCDGRAHLAMRGGSTTTVRVPFTVECDEDGVWSARAWLRSAEMRDTPARAAAKVIAS